MVVVTSLSQAELILHTMMERLKQKNIAKDDATVVNALNDVIKFLKPLAEKGKGADKEKAENLYKIAIALMERI